MTTQKEQKLAYAKANRDLIIERIEKILKDENSYMTLATAMNVFLGAQCKNVDMFMMTNGLLAVRKAAERATKKESSTLFMSEGARRQLPSSMR